MDIDGLKRWMKRGTGSKHEYAFQLDKSLDEITRLRAEVEKWKMAFGAQSRKLQVALDAGGKPVREAVRAALHDGREDG